MSSSSASRFAPNRPRPRAVTALLSFSDRTCLYEPQAKYPQFIKDCEEKGVKYTAVMMAEADPSRGVGRSWKSFFGCPTKEAVEARMAELKYTWEWVDDGTTLRATSPALPAVRVAPGTDRRVFFNQLVAQIANAEEFRRRPGAGDEDTSLSRFLTFGDGSPLDEDILRFAKQACEDTAVELVWQPGDVALLDNFLVMHARRQFEGKRRVLASLVK